MLRPFVRISSALLFTTTSSVCAFTIVPSTPLPKSNIINKHTGYFQSKIAIGTSTQLYGIRCEDKTYQLEELEDQETCTSEVFLQADRTIYFGDTDGPIPVECEGRWDVEPETNSFRMAIKRTFGTGSDSRDMGEFSFDVEKLYMGEMTMVGESVAIQGTVLVRDEFNPEVEKEVGYFNMIDGTQDRLSYVERAGKLTS